MPIDYRDKWCDGKLMCDLFAEIEVRQKVVKVTLPTHVFEYLAQIQLKDGSGIFDGMSLWGAPITLSDDMFVEVEGADGAICRAWMTDKGRRIEHA